MRTRLKKLIGSLVVAFFSWGLALADEVVDKRQPKLPPPIEIRDYQPMNHMMVVEYANGRKFLYQVVGIRPRPECNQVSVEPLSNAIIIITQAPSSAYEYKLGAEPIKTSEWVDWPEKFKNMSE
tara:strand:- start:30 stop:401 length:372 start_codon:yes stop_codon:yes gene_type:complete